MADAVDIVKTCSGLEDPAIAALCRQRLSECGSSWTSDPATSSCTSLTTSCVDQKKAGQSTFELEMPNGGKAGLPSPEACFRAAVRITRTFWPEAWRKSPAPAPDAPLSPAPGPDATPPPSGGEPPPGPSDPDTVKICRGAGDPGTPAFAKCQELVGICRSPEAGGYRLPLGSQSIFAASRAGCLRMAPKIARVQRDRTPDEEKPSAAASTAGAIAPPAAFTPDGRTRFGIGFAQAGFRLHVGPDGRPENILLIPQFDGARKFVPISIVHRIEAIGDGRYRMTYTISSASGAELGGEETTDIQASDGLHLDENLGFGITLNDEGSFGSIASVKIVTLAE